MREQQPTYFIRNRLEEQGAFLNEQVVSHSEPVYLSKEELQQPVSWSRKTDTPATLHDLVAFHYPSTAERFSITPEQIVEEPSVPRVTELNDKEFWKVTGARIEHGIHDLEDIPGIVFARYPRQLLANELEFETEQGEQIVGMVAQKLALMETRLAKDKVHLKK